MKAHAVHYTVRGVPAEVDRTLREMAARKNQSLNQCVVDQLVRATIGTEAKTDFSDFVGAWTSDLAFDEIIASQRQIDPKKWK